MSQIVDVNGKLFRPSPTTEILEMWSHGMEVLAKFSAEPMRDHAAEQCVEQLRASVGIQQAPATITFRRYCPYAKDA